MIVLKRMRMSFQTKILHKKRRNTWEWMCAREQSALNRHDEKSIRSIEEVEHRWATVANVIQFHEYAPNKNFINMFECACSMNDVHTNCWMHSKYMHACMHAWFNIANVRILFIWYFDKVFIRKHQLRRWWIELIIVVQKKCQKTEREKNQHHQDSLHQEMWFRSMMIITLTQQQQQQLIECII